MMTLEKLNLPADELNKDVRQLQKLLQPLAHQPNSSNVHASALRRWFAGHLPPDARACRGYVVGNELCSNIQDVILFDRQTSTLYEESCWKMVPAKGVKAIIRVISGSLAEPALVKVLREFATLGQNIRARTQEEVALGIWAPEAENWSEKELIHLIQLIGESNPMAYTTHLAIGSSMYLQLTDLDSAKPDHKTYAVVEEQLGMAAYLNGGMLAAAMLRHLKNPFDFPLGQPVHAEPKLPAVAPGRMAIPTKKVALKTASKERIIPAKQTEVKVIPQPKRTSSILPNIMRRKKSAEELPQTAIKHIQQDAKGNTPLHQMVLDNNHQGIIKQFKESNAALAIKNKEGNTPLHLACELGYREIVQSILAEGPDVNARNYKYATPLHAAVEEGHKGVIQMLVDAAAEVETRNNLSQTPLHIAAVKGRIACSQILFQAGADISAAMEKGIQPIHLSAWYGEGEMIQALLDTGADINIQNEDGNTPLHFAAFNSQVKAIKVLINHGADPSMKNQLGLTYIEGLNEGYQGEINRLLE
ncbi:MAG: ankyrin repeat domain-containing protein [Bacteroidota bacterium]